MFISPKAKRWLTFSNDVLYVVQYQVDYRLTKGHDKLDSGFAGAET